jgi:hypothetical protein
MRRERERGGRIPGELDASVANTRRAPPPACPSFRSLLTPQISLVCALCVGKQGKARGSAAGRQILQAALPCRLCSQLSWPHSDANRSPTDGWMALVLCLRSLSLASSVCGVSCLCVVRLAKGKGRRWGLRSKRRAAAKISAAPTNTARARAPRHLQRKQNRETIEDASTILCAPLSSSFAPGKGVFSEVQAAVSHGKVTDPKERRVGHRDTRAETETDRGQGGRNGQTTWVTYQLPLLSRLLVSAPRGCSSHSA